MFKWVQYLEDNEKKIKKTNWLLLRPSFLWVWGNLANAEVLLLVFYYSDGPDTCPFVKP